ncbi:UNVERIFIED_CONTAM: hypothetical protein Sradi_5713900 [Sesamum radiatum]|uniref:Uncharacterized protein n=1 Tax=Sesamum radiatum TaxID=300843 RepID=A0AAW2L4H6_SESRA
MWRRWRGGCTTIEGGTGSQRLLDERGVAAEWSLLAALLLLETTDYATEVRSGGCGGELSAQVRRRCES